MKQVKPEDLAKSQQVPEFGKTLPFLDADNDAIFYSVGTQLADARNWAKYELIGADGLTWWDDHKEIYVNQRPQGQTADDGFYRLGVVRGEDGKITTIPIAHLRQPVSPDDRWWIEKYRKPKLGFLSFDDMVALPDPEWLVEGLIQRKTSALMFGKSNSFKSFLAIDMACAIATLDDWHGHEIKQRGNVLYVATEGALGVAKQRIPGWMQANGITGEDRNRVNLYPEEIALDDTTAIDALLQTCAYHASIRKLDRQETVWNEEDPSGAFDLIVIDIFGASMAGSEVTDETARAWVRNVNRIMREVGCAVLTVAHTGWADDTRARMHTHFWGSFDTRMKAAGDKESRTTVLTIDRHKDADSAGEWGFRLDVVPTPTGGTTLVPRLCDEVEKGQKRRVSGKPAVALQALSEALIEKGRTIAGPNYPNRPVVSLEDWRAYCHRQGMTKTDTTEAKRKAFDRARDTLLEKGLIRQFDGQVWTTGDE